jgi:hypothetical protein
VVVNWPVVCTCELPYRVCVRVKSSIKVWGGGSPSSCSWGFCVTHRTENSDQAVHHPVVHLWSRGLDFECLQMISNESWWKLFQTHYWEGPISVGIGTPMVKENQTSHNERGNRSLLVRHLIWLRNPRGFQLRDHDGGSPGSMTYISKGKTDGWSLFYYWPKEPWLSV